VDSSGWIEYLADRPRAAAFAPYLEGREEQVVCAIQIYEVFKVVRRDLSEERAIAAVSAMHRAHVQPVDAALALEAADVALSHRLAMADALVYATASKHRARLVTGDSDFDGLDGVILIR
jgi:predicted nucleic acid-binding protein